MFVQTAKAAASRSRAPSAFLLVILLLAAVPRLMGIGWDGGYMAHPDERHIYDVTAERLQWAGPSSALLDAENSSMNPRRSDGADGYLSYSYGTLLVYGLKAISSLVAVVAGDQYAEFAGLYQVGRPLAALADLLTIVCVYLLGVRLFSRRAGLLAAALSAATVLQVQFSHFYVAEPIMTLFLTAALLQVVRALQDRNGRAVLYAGLLLGLAVATKPSAAAFVPAALLLLYTGGYAVHSQVGATGWRSIQQRLVRAGRLAVVAGAVSVATWAVFEPYAVLDIRTYIENILAESRIQRGITDVPFTRQYIGAIPGWYHLGQYARWGVGLPLGAAVVAGSIWGGYRAVVRRDVRCALLFGWIAPYSLSILALEAKWLRYMLPVTPALLLLVSAALWTWHAHLWAGGRRRAPLHPLRARLALLAIGAVLSGSVLWTIAWSSIYTRPHNWIQASEWIYANSEPGSTLAHEAWDERLPYALPGQDADTYEYLQVDTYEDLSPDQRLFAIQDMLTAADYIVLPTPRLWATVPKSPWRYAVATRYFDLLFEERLGFRRVAVFEDGPGLGGARIDDTGSDDNVAVYDHPQVLIFKKERDLQQWEFDALFVEAREAPWEATRQGSTEKSLLLAPYQDSAVTGTDYFQGTWNRGITSIIAWLLVLEVLAGMAWLLLRGLLRPLPDAGWVLSRVLGLLLVGWLSWLLASLGALPATPWAAWLVLGVLLAVALVLAFRSRTELRADLRTVGSTIACFEALFLVLFGLGLLLRAANPDLWQPYWGGEKPMELAFINGILRSTELPPYDPWFSGGYINYYYFGQWLVTTLMRLSSVGPQYGFNLAVATVLSLTGTLAAGIGYTLARGLGRRAGVVVGGASLGLLLLIGNLDGAVQVLEPLSKSEARTLLRDGDLPGALRVGWSTMAETLPRLAEGFDFWRSTRLLPEQNFINEFPFFTYLYGDLHAHMLAMPLGLTLLSLGVLLVGARGNLPSHAVYLATAVGGLLAGAISTTNPWDTPAYAGLFLLALAYYWLGASRRPLRNAAHLAGTSGLFVLVGAGGFAPFFLAFKSFYGEVGRVTTPTPLPVFLVLLGLFLYLVAWYCVVQSWRSNLGRLLVAGAAVIVVLAAAQGHGVLALLVALLGLMLYTGWRNRSASATLIWTALAAGGLFIWVGIEVLYLRDFNDGGAAYRMNTIFKFGLQSWILLALGCAGLVYLTFTETRGLLRRSLPVSIATVLLACSLVYPAYGGAVRLRQRFPEPPPGRTLDGEAFLRTASLPNESGRPENFAQDYAAIQWMRANITAPHPFAEAAIGPYRGNGGRISMFTGQPAVVGWDNHEGQQRYPEPVAQRNRDVRDLYNSPDPQRALEVISRYGIRYIYVGPVERLHEFAGEPTPERYASTAGLAKFERMKGETVRTVYQRQGVIIYEVLPSWRWKLPQATGPSAPLG